MDETERTIRVLIVAVATVFVSICGSCSFQSANDNATLVEMASKGANPLDAKCAVKGGNSETAICAIRATVR